MAHLIHRFTQLTSTFICVALLFACSTPKMNIPVDDLSARFRHIPNTYIAKENDNLFKISMKYGMDYNQLGKINNIPYPYALKKGQIVYLNQQKVKINAKIQKQTAESTNLQTKLSTIDISTKKSDDEVGTQNPLISTSRIAKKTKEKYGIVWQRPIEGKVSKNYQDLPKNYKGIDIHVMLDTPVYAAADGIVSYSGDDALSKYGKLIIINHQDIILSAYAHVKKLLVDEGEEVHRGQLIAQSGKTGTNIPKLHFEIRREGNSINPESVLPQ